MAQHRVAGTVRHIVQQQFLGQAAQPHAGAVVAPVHTALQQAGGFQLLQHAVQRGFGQLGFFGQLLQREKLVFRGNDFQQGKQPHRGRVAVDFDRMLRRGGHDFHGPNHSLISINGTNNSIY